MGWGEPKGPSAKMVERAEFTRKALALADAVYKFRRKMDNSESPWSAINDMYKALDEFVDIRKQMLAG